MISSSQRPLPDNTRHSQQTNIHAPGGIRTHDLSRRAAADLPLRPRGHWDRQHVLFLSVIFYSQTSRKLVGRFCSFGGTYGLHLCYSIMKISLVVFLKCWYQSTKVQGVRLQNKINTHGSTMRTSILTINPLKPELNPICYLLALLAHHFLHVSRIRVKSLTLR